MWREADAGLKKLNLFATVKHSGRLIWYEDDLILLCRKLVFIESKMNAEYYVNILSNNLPDSARLIGLENYIF